MPGLPADTEYMKMPWISINELKRRIGYEERRKRRDETMPFGEYAPIFCGNKDCPERQAGRKFKPTTPWQDCCCKTCRMHKAYLDGKKRKPSRRKA